MKLSVSSGEVKFKLEHTEVASQAFFLALCSQSKGLSSAETEPQILPRIPNPQPCPHLICPSSTGQGGTLRTNTHHMPFAGQWDKDVTTFMDQQLAVDTLVALPWEPPYPFTALATVRSLQATRHTISSRINPCCKHRSLTAKAHPSHLNVQ